MIMRRFEKIISLIIDEIYNIWFRICDNNEKHVIFYCSNCKFNISVTIRKNPYISVCLGYYFEYDEKSDDYKEYKILPEEKESFSLINQPATHICLNCGNTLTYKNRNKHQICNKCNGNNIIFWKNIAGKKCFICNGIFDEGKYLKTNDEYNKEYSNTRKSIFLEAINKFGIIPEKYTKEGIEDRNKFLNLLDIYFDKRYTIFKNKNVIKFVCERSFHGNFCIIVEWDKNNYELIFCLNGLSENENDKYFAINIDNNKISILINILEKHKYFKKSHKNKNFGLDGSTWTLEVKYGLLYKEISEWSPSKGVIYDIGKYLIELSNANRYIKELY